MHFFVDLFDRMLYIISEIDVIVQSPPFEKILGNNNFEERDVLQTISFFVDII